MQAEGGLIVDAFVIIMAVVAGAIVGGFAVKLLGNIPSD